MGGGDPPVRRKRHWRHIAVRFSENAPRRLPPRLLAARDPRPGQRTALVSTRPLHRVAGDCRVGTSRRGIPRTQPSSQFPPSLRGRCEHKYCRQCTRSQCLRSLGRDQTDAGRSRRHVLPGEVRRNPAFSATFAPRSLRRRLEAVFEQTPFCAREPDIQRVLAALEFAAGIFSAPARFKFCARCATVSPLYCCALWFDMAIVASHTAALQQKEVDDRAFPSGRTFVKPFCPAWCAAPRRTSTRGAAGHRS